MRFKNARGQSLIEFLLTFTFSIGLLFIFIGIAISATDGFLVHYATFMASRTYLVVDLNSNDPDASDAKASEEAARIFSKYVKQKTGEIVSFSPLDRQGLPYVGTTYNFKQNFTTGLIGGSHELNLRSESFLGKEPTRATCAYRICKAFELVGGDCQLLRHFTLFDNGC